MVSVTVEDGLEIVGDNHKYQITLTILLFLIGTISDIPFHAVPVMETNPIVSFQSNNQTHNDIINYTICQNFNYTVNTSASKSTWVLDYNIYCDKLYVSFIGFFVLLGGLLGTILIHFLKEQSRKWPFIIVSLVMSFSSILLLHKNYFLLIIYNMICGMCGIMLYVWRINTITEITSKESRSYYNNVQLSSGNFCVILIFTLFNDDVNWRIFFFGNAILLNLLIFFYFRTYIENPRFFYLKAEKDKMLNSLLRIASFNGTDHDPLFNNKINTFMRYIKFGETCKYEQAINSPPIDNVISVHKESSMVEVYTSESVRVDTRLNTEISNNTSKLNEEKLDKFDYINFTISAPLCSFLAFMYNFEIKNLSYKMGSAIYFFSILTIIFLFVISPIMNLIGRKISKMITLGIFFVILIIIKSYDGIFSVSFMYLINRMFIHLTNHINHTHLNETFPTNRRLFMFNITHLISKFLLLSAPLIYEYLDSYRFHIEIFIIAILCICFVFQKETANKRLHDK